ncbi:MAG: DEAD/DEAH box helicase [Candidatus Margulisbacteria bacterium]|nr:DEAD/DEAH box helicase [Candidatus Margulisiibacteriota bacterium]MBU1616503.1 DEAD/DEAH box helicase [Candidatus Margulisiibacteriota bacterium]
MNNENLTFYGLGLAPKTLGVLEKLKFTTPTPIQHKAIPVAVEGKDLVGIAQTGTGKTLAFGIPMIQRLATEQGKGLILVPTRELALQVEESLRLFCQAYNVRPAVLIGGASMERQIQALRRQARIIIATPGRLIDHLSQGNVYLGDARIVVLDEADRMLDMGFAPQIEQVLKTVPREKQTMLFSATMPVEIVRVASKYMKLPIRIEVAPPGTAAEKVSQEVFIVRKEAKLPMLCKLLEQYRGTVLVFCRTKRGAFRVARDLQSRRINAADIHSDRSLAQRREALEGFKRGKYRVLVATDIAARGIDVKGIELVVNFDLPDDSENYVHRIGRTARAGSEGKAISLATPDQEKEFRSIERMMKLSIPVGRHPEIMTEGFDRGSSSPPSRHFQPRRGNSPSHRPQRPARQSGFRRPQNQPERPRAPLAERKESPPAATRPQKYGFGIDDILAAMKKEGK